MTWIILGAVVLGIALGHWVIPAQYIQQLDYVTTTSLYLLLLAIGIDLGRQKEVWVRLSIWAGMNYKFRVPVAWGCLAGAVVHRLSIGMPIYLDL